MQPEPTSPVAADDRPTVAGLVANTVDLATLPTVYVQARALIEDPDSSIGELTAVISHDPAMTGRLLRISNSAYFGMAARIDTVARAITLLGMQQVHDLVLATSVAGALDGLKSDTVDRESFWRECVRRAVAARLLATHCNVLDTERLFVQGLLCNVGWLVLAAGAPACIAALGWHPTRSAQRALLGFDLAELGGALLEAWRLPEPVHLPIRHHLEPLRAPDFQLEACIVHVATTFGAGPEDCGGAETDLSAAVFDVIGLDTGLLEALFVDVGVQTADALDLLFGAGRRGVPANARTGSRRSKASRPALR